MSENIGCNDRKNIRNYYFVEQEMQTLFWLIHHVASDALDAERPNPGQLSAPFHLSTSIGIQLYQDMAGAIRHLFIFKKFIELQA